MRHAVWIILFAFNQQSNAKELTVSPNNDALDALVDSMVDMLFPLAFERKAMPPRWDMKEPEETTPQSLFNKKKEKGEKTLDPQLLAPLAGFDKFNRRKPVAPGTIVILLVGEYAARRVVMIKELSNKEMLVAGPPSINTVPLQKYKRGWVLPTSKIIPGVKDLDLSKYNATNMEDSFPWEEAAQSTLNLKQVIDLKQRIFEEELENYPLYPEKTPEKIEAEQLIYPALEAEIAKIPLMARYLNTKFSLLDGKNGLNRPHLLRF